ncbi:hypothetical protein Ddc_13442 [Ditylenchus destructor]|nr:hypothetical protein Ddc_13442 [Ditylenchus destructor]
MSTTLPEPDLRTVPDPKTVKEVDVNADLRATEPVLRMFKPFFDRFFPFDIKDLSAKCKIESSRPKALLHLFIALSMYGPPDESAFSDDNDKVFYQCADKKFSLYPKEKRKHFMKMFNSLVKCAKESVEDRLEFSRILLSIKKDDDGCITHQVLIKVRCYVRIPKTTDKQECFLYVDYIGRIYRSFADFLNNNKLPKCLFCYIDENNVLQFDKSVALKRKILRIGLFGGDILAAGAGVGAVVLTALLASPAALVAGTAVTVVSSVYFVGRNSVQLYDNTSHGQDELNGENVLLTFGTFFGAFGAVTAPLGALVATKVISTSVVAKAAKNPIGCFLLSILGKEGPLGSATATEVAVLGARRVSGLLTVINDVLDDIDSVFLDAPYATEEVKLLKKGKLLKLLKNLEKLANMMFIFHNTVMPLETMGHVVVIFKKRCPGLFANDNSQKLDSLDVLETLYAIIRDFDTGIDDSQHGLNERPLMDLFVKTELAQRIKDQAIA